MSRESSKQVVYKFSGLSTGDVDVLIAGLTALIDKYNDGRYGGEAGTLNIKNRAEELRTFMENA